MKTLKIKWQRLVSNGQTCKRCGATEKELERAISALKKAMPPLGIKVVLEKKKLSFRAFKKEPSRSNRIWINNRLVEEWIGAQAGQNLCCDVCGDAECRTVEVGGRVYEEVPARLVIQAGLLAASRLIGTGIKKKK